MIPYQGHLFGLGILTRVHGSAVYKAVIPSCISMIFYLSLFFFYPGAEDLSDIDERILGHPYSVAVLVRHYLVTYNICL